MKHIILMMLFVATAWAASAQNNPIFNGGNGDGWSVAFFLQPSVNIFTGGLGDGYSTNNFLQPGNNIYSGGNGDGWSSDYIPPGALPLHLISFKATRKNNNALLTWQTANEVNTAYFNIQRSLGGVNFVVVGKINANNAALQHDYQFNDDISMFNSDKIYYRLQITDKDSRVNYSDVKYIDLQGEFHVAIVPNPIINNKVNLKIYSPGNAKLQLMICNTLGKIIFVQEFNSAEGNSIRTLNVSTLASGIYLVRLTDGIVTQTVRLVK